MSKTRKRHEPYNKEQENGTENENQREIGEMIRNKRFTPEKLLGKDCETNVSKEVTGNLESVKELQRRKQ